MDSDKKKKTREGVPFFASLQVKYALSYLVVITLVLALLNTYPVLASQDLLFTSKRDSLKSQSAVIASALMELETLTSDQVVRVMNLLDDMGLSRILVPDPAGLVLYDSATDNWDRSGKEEPEEPQYRYALYQEVAAALEGKDVFYSHYADGVFTSTAAVPIVSRGMTTGAVYVLETDREQGNLLQSLQQNLANISAVIVASALVVSLFFSKMLTARIAALLHAFRVVGEGEYGHRLQPAGRDEMAQLAQEFNRLTDRLQTTEEVRRRFVSDASHELKTPLASIRLLTDSILQNQQMDQETLRDFVKDIGDEAERLTRIENYDEELAALKHEVDEAESQVRNLAEQLTRVRRQSAANISSTLTERVKPLGMPHLQFEIEVSTRPQFDETGGDAIRFLFSANKNQPLQPVSEVASGGEISRLMLSLKALVAHAMALPTIVFDEVDTGVSGEIADKMARIMRDMSRCMQVISITHLPQVAAWGQTHYRVYKSDTATATATHLVRLTDSERVEEIARMLSGSSLTAAALDNARELLNRNEQNNGKE